MMYSIGNFLIKQYSLQIFFAVFFGVFVRIVKAQSSQGGREQTISDTA